MVGLKPEPNVAGPPRQCQQPGAKPMCIVQFASSPTEHPLSPKRGKNLRALAQAIAKRLGSHIGVQHLGCAEATKRHEGCSQRDAQFDLDLDALGLVSDVSDGVQRVPEMADRLLIGALPQRFGGSALMVRDRARQLVAALEMLCKLGCDRIQSASPSGFQPAADARM